MGFQVLLSDGSDACLCYCHGYVFIYVMLLCTNSSSVLNPSVRMSWIRKHWEPDYIKKAEHIVKKIVCFVVCSGPELMIVVDGGVSCMFCTCCLVCSCSTEHGEVANPG